MNISCPIREPLTKINISLLWHLFIAFILGVILGGTLKGLARFILGMALLAGFVVLILFLLNKQDIFSLIISGIFGIIMLIFSIFTKLGKSYIPKG